MGAANFGGLYIDGAMGLQLMIGRTVNCARDQDTRVAGLPDLLYIVFGIGSIAYQRQLVGRFNLFEGLAHEQGVVFRL